MASAVSPATLRRLMKEVQNEQQVPATSNPARKQAARDENIVRLAPKDSELHDLLEWTAIIQGPEGGYYEGESDSVRAKE